MQVKSFSQYWHIMQVQKVLAITNSSNIAAASSIIFSDY